MIIYSFCIDRIMTVHCLTQWDDFKHFEGEKHKVRRYKSQAGDRYQMGITLNQYYISDLKTLQDE